MSWSEFIKEIARQKLPSERQRLTFVEIFGDNESQKIDKTIEGHLREIYKRFEAVCSELTIAKKGKKEILREYLQTLYASQGNVAEISDRPQTPTNQNISTPEPITELTTLEFIGRDRDLTNLANHSKQHKIVLVKAGAGVGKSTLAREFLQTQFKKVIRLEMGLESGNVTPAEEKVSQILRKDFDEEPSRDFGINLDILREKLADRTNPIGVLIDNLEPALDENYRFREKLRGYDALLAVLGDRDICSFTLITSRRSLITPRARVHEYLLEGLDIIAWRQYFYDCDNGADSEALLQMCVAYNGNAKVMDILHGAIKTRFDGNIGAYWSRYKDTLLADSELETLISVEMDWLRDHQPDAYKLLCRMGCYRYQDVKTVPFEGLICLLWDVPDSQRIGIVGYLSKTSLIEIRGEYYLHPAVSEAANTRLKNSLMDYYDSNLKIGEFWQSKINRLEPLRDISILLEAIEHYSEINRLDKIFEIFHMYIEVDSYKYLKICFRDQIRYLGYLPSLIRLLSKVSDPHNPKLEGQRLGFLGVCYLMSNEYNKAIEHFKILDSYFDVNTRLSAYTMQWLAKAYLYVGKLERAFQCCEIALDRLNNSVDLIDDESLVNSVFTIKGRIYQTQGEYQKAIDEYTKVIEEVQREIDKRLERDRELGSQLEARADALAYRAKCYLFDQGKISDAIESCMQSVQAFTEINQLSNVIAAKTFLVDIYTKAGKYLDAELLLNSFEDKDNKIVIEKNVWNLENHILYVKGVYEIANKQFDIGLEYLLRVTQIWEQSNYVIYLGEVYIQIGLTYQVKGEHDQAKVYKEKALKLFKQMEAPKQIERVNKAFGGNIQ